MMFEKRFVQCWRNGKENGTAKTGNPKSSRIWRNFQINERTFTLFLIVLSLSIIVGKLHSNYGPSLQSLMNMVKTEQSLPVYSSVYGIFGNLQKWSSPNEQCTKTTSERLMNVSREYGDVIAGAVVGITHKYSWLFRALLSGLAMMAFTWFIVYKDSDVPGENPPSPFSPGKKRVAGSSRLQLNYLIGVLNGVLICVYMCL